MTADELVAWADAQIAHCDVRAMPTWLIELSLRGPVACFKDPTLEFPQPVELSFSDRFAVRVVALNANRDADVEQFVRWAARTAMGEDLQLPEVEFSYGIEHLAFDCDAMDRAVDEVRKALPALRERMKVRAADLFFAE